MVLNPVIKIDFEKTEDLPGQLEIRVVLAQQVNEF